MDSSIAGREAGAAGRAGVEPVVPVRAKPRAAATPRADAGAPERILARVAAEIGEEPFARHFKGQAHLRLAGATLDVMVPTGFIADLLGRKYADALRRAAAPEAGGGEVKVRFRIDRKEFTRESIAPALPPRPARPSPRAATADTSPRATLDDFVVGRCNRLAYEAACRIAGGEDPRSFGLLFIHGPCGVGKTHLLQGIVRRGREASPGAKVRYTTAEAFTNEYIAAVRAGTLDGFRRAYRAVGLLCVDDVHFLSSKQATQAELLHTFDAIGNGGSRIVLASDAPPRQISRMSESLVSRFMSGMVVRLDPPDEELRTEVVRRLAAARGLPLEPGSAQIIASMASGPGGSVRDLEGAVTRVEAVWRMMAGGAPVGATLIRKAMGMGGPGDAAGGYGGLIRRPRRPVTAAHIATEVCRALRVEHADFTGRGRHKRVVLARAATAHLCRSLTTMSYPEIARAMGRPNHSTIVTAVKRLAAQIEGDEPVDPAAVEGAADLAPPGEGRPVTVRQVIERLSQDVARSAASEPGRQ